MENVVENNMIVEDDDEDSSIEEVDPDENLYDDE